MAAIDVRENQPIDTIIFADEEATSAGAYKLENYCSNEIVILNNNDESVYLKHSDIDNLIAALHKAKELWVGK
jgi:GT2 family glycosyltransferase